MKKHKLTVLILAILVALTAVLAVVHLATRQQGTENAIQVVYGGKIVAVPLDELALVPVQGTMVTGKGEQRPIDGMGISVADLLKQANAPAWGVSVVSDDEYSVSLTAEEVAADNKAWFLMEEGSARLIVFGDENSKRNVKNVVRLTIPVE